MHDFYPRDRTAGRPKGLEPEHGTRQPFHCSMVLLHDIIEIFGVADDDGGLVRLVVVRESLPCCSPLLSMVIFSGSPWVRMALRKKASAASRSRVGVKRKSIVWPSLSLPKPGCHHPALGSRTVHES